MENTGIEFLIKIYNDLHNSDIVKHTSSVSDTKEQAIEKYLNRLETITERAYKKDIDINHLKELYYDKYVIKPNDIPESYFEHKEQLALDRGYGHITYRESMRQEEIKKIINEQKISLDSWIDYFASPDSKHYPTWFKYYCFQGMIKLGFFDKEKDKYTKRTSSTIKPFIEINREALALVYDELTKILNKETIDDKKLEALINGGSFGKIYAYIIKKLDSIKKDNSNSDEGIWKKYNQGSNPEILVNDIQGKGTGWCTAGIETARNHLRGGDFFVYYTKDSEGKYTLPRIAIRTEVGKILEIRGVLEYQNLESSMEEVVEKKLEEFADRGEYKKKIHDMKILTNIYIKWKNKEELTKEDLRFVYEIDGKIKEFGYVRDPRINEIKEDRNIREDLKKVLDCNEEQISLTEAEALKGGILYHYGLLYGQFLNYNLTSGKVVTFPQNIVGDLDLCDTTSSEGIILPQTVRDSVNLRRLKSGKGLKLPKNIGGNLNLCKLTSAEGLELPENIGGNLYLENLTSGKGLKLPKNIEGCLYLNNLTSVEDMIIPDELHCPVSCPIARTLDVLKAMCEYNKKIL